jgi:hypothetical protein
MWSREESELVCRGVGWFGYDFEIISRLFVSRNRNTVKRRWKRVEKEEPERAREAWERREPVGACTTIAPLLVLSARWDGEC